MIHEDDEQGSKTKKNLEFKTSNIFLFKEQPYLCHFHLKTQQRSDVENLLLVITKEDGEVLKLNPKQHLEMKRKKTPDFSTYLYKTENEKEQKMQDKGIRNIEEETPISATISVASLLNYPNPLSRLPPN
ncbi:hypothetical protein NE237_015728 [Protea cynaroides]|uniref:Uncharacterized protein n=1 Tax=Protea cynaroides TaxID=273540 RepID=A0A9Q0QRB2_9MAGN|nr:hypothetical protein NE237_015728 [Protea cynaroides]